MAFRKEYFDTFMLKASMYGEFNDPFDLVLGDYAESLSEDERKAFYDAMPEHYNCPNYHYDTSLDIQAGVQDSVSVMSFTRKFRNILMWSHYANNHTGVCIGYDYNCEFFKKKFSCNYSDEIGVIRKVEYTNERPKYFFPTDLVNDTREWFKKSKDWAYEKEYRILLPIKNAVCKNDRGKFIFLFEIDPKYIKKVILGCMMKEDDKKYIHEKLSRYNIHIIEAEPHPAHYKLTFKKSNKITLKD